MNLRGASIWSEDVTNLPSFHYGNLRIATLQDPEGNLVQLLEPLKI
jgi:hypothetical protein